MTFTKSCIRLDQRRRYDKVLSIIDEDFSNTELLPHHHRLLGESCVLLIT